MELLVLQAKYTKPRFSNCSFSLFACFGRVLVSSSPLCHGVNLISRQF